MHVVALALLVASSDDWANETHVRLGIVGRNGDLVSVAVAGLKDLAGEGAVLAAVWRVELGLAGAGAGAGLMLHEELRPCATGAYANLQAKLLRTWWSPPNWRNSTYAGPELVVGLWGIKGTLGWMVDLHEAAPRELQIGLGFGY
jgi:hypothetical protein